jgi:hypothetical protein
MQNSRERFNRTEIKNYDSLIEMELKDIDLEIKKSNRAADPNEVGSGLIGV